ncbi:unnamed protein product [Spodoptera exigua]|nr:unnamed protein product [Spodoptera exigua]
MMSTALNSFRLSVRDSVEGVVPLPSRRYFRFFFRRSYCHQRCFSCSFRLCLIQLSLQIRNHELHVVVTGAGEGFHPSLHGGLRVGTQVVCAPTLALERYLKTVRFFFRQLNSTPFQNDYTDWFLVPFLVEIKQEVAFQHEPSFLVTFADFASHVQPPVAVHRRRRRRESAQILFVYFHCHL